MTTTKMIAISLSILLFVVASTTLTDAFAPTFTSPKITRTKLSMAMERTYIMVRVITNIVVPEVLVCSSFCIAIAIVDWMYVSMHTWFKGTRK